VLVVGEHLRHGELVYALAELPLAVLATSLASVRRRLKLIPQDLATLDAAAVASDDILVRHTCALYQLFGVLVHGSRPVL
jgi:hypothetical protein